MTHDNLCARCDRPTDGYVCADDARTLARELRQAAGLAGELLTTVARLARIGTGGRSSGEPPLPFSWDAADARWAISNTLTTWARLVSEERGVPVGADVAAWLAEQTEWLRHHPDAVQAYDELHDCCRLLVRTVDRPAERSFVGACACGGYLYARAGALDVTCPQCGTAYDTAAAKAQLMEEISGMLFTAAELATLAVFFLPERAYRRDRVRNLVNKWAERATIVAHGHIVVLVRGEAVQVPTYPLGETIRKIASAQLRSTG